MLGRRAQDFESGRRKAEAAITSGAAFEKFRILVEAQAGDVSFIDEPQKFPKAKFIENVKADQSGYLTRVHARIIGEAAVALGAGRARKGDFVDHAVGFLIHRKVGDYVEKNHPLFTIYANDEVKLAEARIGVRTALGWSDKPVLPLPLFYT